MGYFESLSQISVPTRLQTVRFCAHVAANHSWYKHLPFFPPGAGFLLFLNPLAGCGIRRTSENIEPFEVQSGDYFKHDSRLSTVVYRNKFGCWDYWVDNPRDREPHRPRLFSAPAMPKTEFLPDEIVRQWTCRLTAFVKISTRMLAMCPTELRNEREKFLVEFEKQVETQSSQTHHSGLSETGRYLRLAEQLSSDVLEERPNATFELHHPEPLFGFLETECKFQQRKLLDKLISVRNACIGRQMRPTEEAVSVDRLELLACALAQARSHDIDDMSSTIERLEWIELECRKGRDPAQSNEIFVIGGPDAVELESYDPELVELLYRVQAEFDRW